MNEEELSRIARLGAADGTPQARPLDPEVRSGASFSFGAGALPGAATWPRVLVVWFYTVLPADRPAFEAKVAILETAAAPAAAGVTYRGTYSVTVSGAAPDFEYRTVWGLDSFAALQDLNNLLHGAAVAAPNLSDCLKLISPLPAMRTEIMGRTVLSTVIAGG